MKPAVAAVPSTPEERDAFTRKATGQPQSTSAIPFFTAEAIWGGYSAPGYLIKRIAEPRAVTSIFGDQGSYKSAIAVALAGSVATGLPFYGAKVRQAAAAFIAGEGVGGMRKRLRAWLMANGFREGDEPLPPIAVTEGPASLTDNCEQLKSTISEIEAQLTAPVELVIIDTLSANFGSGEENSASDMSLAIANARRAAPDAALVVIHHTGIGGDRERGSSSFPFGCDFRFRAIYDKEARTVELRNVKQKDDELQPSLFFAPRRFSVGWVDADGLEMTAVILDRVGAPEDSPSGAPGRAGTSGLGTNQESVLKVLQRLYRIQCKKLQAEGEDTNKATVLLSGLRNAVVDEKIMINPRFREALDGLTQRGLVTIEGQVIRLNIEARSKRDE